MRILLVVSDAYLVGLVLTVALVIYPSFRLVDAGHWETLHSAHVNRIRWAVAPGWLLQGAGSIWWLIEDPRNLVSRAHAALAAVAVLATLLGAVPRHHELGLEFSAKALRELELWNWLRATAWIGCVLCAVAVL